MVVYIRLGFGLGCRVVVWGMVGTGDSIMVHGRV